MGLLVSATSPGCRITGGGEAVLRGELDWLFWDPTSSLGLPGVGEGVVVEVTGIGWFKASAHNTQTKTSAGIGEKGGHKGSIIALSSPGLFGA